MPTRNVNLTDELQNFEGDIDAEICEGSRGFTCEKNSSRQAKLFAPFAQRALSKFTYSASMAIYYGYNLNMDVNIAEARNRLTRLIRAVEAGEQVVITRNGKPVAQLAPPPRERRKVQFGGMRDRIRLLKGWDDPADIDRFLDGGI
jgi:prevent-host-death family protein